MKLWWRCSRLLLSSSIACGSKVWQPCIPWFIKCKILLSLLHCLKVKAKNSDLIKASEKQYRLEQELAFYKLDAKFEMLDQMPWLGDEQVKIWYWNKYVELISTCVKSLLLGSQFCEVMQPMWASSNKYEWKIISRFLQHLSKTLHMLF